MRHVWEKGEMHTGFWWRYLRERGHLEEPGVDGRIILKYIFKIWDGEAWIGMTRLRIERRGGLL